MCEKDTVGGNEKECTQCKVTQPLANFYKKGSRFEAKCKDCLKEIRAKAYRKKKELPEWYAKCRITKVEVKKKNVENKPKYKRELEAVELILENLVYKALTDELKRGVNS